MTEYSDFSDLDSSDTFTFQTDEYVAGIRAEDLHGNPGSKRGRLLIVFPQRYDRASSDNGDFDVVYADIAVLDGPTTDIIPTVPGWYSDVRLSAGRIVRMCTTRLKAGNVNPMVQRMESGPGRNGGKSYGFIPATPDELSRAQAWYNANKHLRPSGL